MNARKSKSGEPDKDNSTAKSDSDQFPIVGIGASAGGLEALEQFFEKMPKKSGMAFVVVQHLDPNHAGMMPELLQRFTSMKVCQASDRLKVKPDCVYVIPPNRSLTILHKVLHLFEPVESRGLRLPIDIFFRSLADDQKGKSVGIVLSGMGSDGSLGLKAIKEKNGVVLIQDPATAKFDGMPRSALESVIPDIVASSEDLPSRLVEFLKIVPFTKSESVIIDSKTKSNLEKIIILLREQSGHDFSMYRKNTLFRRIERRKGIHQIEKINTYVRYLQENPKEVEILFKELLIGVTSFFRDAFVWELLKDKVFPALLNELSDGHVLRAWVPGCSTGEEAYSLAIIFKEALEKIKKHKNLSLQVFATDLDVEAIDKARTGLYPSNISADVTNDRLTRFFTTEPNGFRVNSAIREMVVFAPHNVIQDPPFTKLDFLSCRNMMIYMEPELQKKLISLFSYSLNLGGILMLGMAESIGVQNAGFDVINTKAKIFKHTASSTLVDVIDFPSSVYQTRTPSIEKAKPHVIVENVQSITDQFLFQHHTPASVLVNAKGDVIYMTGSIAKYLEPVAGKANYNIYVMAREGLSQVLPIAFRKAVQNKATVRINNIKLGGIGKSQIVDVTIQRFDKPDALKGLILFVFTDIPDWIENEILIPKTNKPDEHGRHKELKFELQRCYEDLQSTREEMQTSQEELKSSNEELQSTNEELQSTNEELTTSKEEMQSLNEELQTVNIELQNKVSDYSRANNDMKNLLNNIEIATVFVDKDLKIRRFTDPATKIFKLRDSDIGRPFTDQVSNLQYPDLENHAREVIASLIFRETKVPTNDGHWFNVRIMPYRTHDNYIDGLVMTFTDITEFKKMELALK